MRLPIVDNAERPVELDWLRIQRVGPVGPTRQRLDVRRDPRERRRMLHAPHHDEHDDDHAELDAQLAGELVSAVRTLLERERVAIDASAHGDGLRYELEVSWGGVVQRFEVDGEPTDDALHGVLRLATPLMDPQEHVTGAAASRLGDPAGAGDQSAPDAGIVVVDATSIEPQDE